VRQPDDLLDRFEIARFAAAPAASAPGAGAGAGEPTRAGDPILGAFDRPRRLDAGRARAEPEWRRPPPASRLQRTLPFALIASVALHLLPLLALLAWRAAPADIAAPIPVQLVIVRPPPPSPPPAPPREKPPPEKMRPPPPGRLASEDVGNPAARQRRPPQGAAPATVAPEAGPPKMVAVLPPLPARPFELPPPSEERPATEADLPRPRPRPTSAKAPVVRRSAPVQREAAHFGLILGPAASRDEYLAYCNALIRRHFDLLPLSYVGGRRGLTVLTLLVLDDGTIAHIAVARSSGYPDIDRRVEQIVAAVRRFPPVPQWFQGEAMSLEYELPFPGALLLR
jgi:TonB family protein